MRTLYLFSSIDKQNGFYEEQIKWLNNDIKDSNILTVISSDFSDIEKSKSRLEVIKGWFKKINKEFKEVNSIDDSVSKEDAIDMIKRADVLFIMGGDPEIEMNCINEYGLNDTIKEFNKVIIGVSAGSMNMANDVVYIDYEKEDIVRKYKGLGLTDLYIYPHIEIDDLAILKESFEVSKYVDAIYLPNESFIRIKENIDYIGEYYILKFNKKCYTQYRI